MEVRLYDRLAQRPVAAEITTLRHCHIENLNSCWIPAFQLRHHAQERDEDYLMWNMGKGDLDDVIHREGLRSFALIAEENVQGVLLLNGETQPSRLEPRHRLIYVRYVATAPWNRRDKGVPGRLRGVGTLLMAWAMQESLNMDCNGRLGLHSLRGSNDFYHLLGLDNLGLDAAHRGMNYFELSYSRATEFSEAVRSEAVGITPNIKPRI